MKLLPLAACLLCCLFGGPLAAQATVEITNPDTIRICRGDVVELMQTNTVGDAGLRWSPAEGFLDPVTDPSPRVAPRFSRYYRVQVTGPGGRTLRDSVYLDVDSLVVPSLIPDTVVCNRTVLALTPEPIADAFETTFRVLPTDIMVDSFDFNAGIVVPDTALVVTVIAAVANGACADTQSVTITPRVGTLEFLGEDTILICGNNDAVLALDVAAITDGTPPNPDDFDFFPFTNVVRRGDFQFELRPRGVNTYFISGTVNGCVRNDSVTVRVDSLPDDTSITLDPVKDPYCQGDTVFLRSPNFEVADYPLVRHNWFQAPGLQSPRELYNAVIFAVDTAFMVRETTNGACVRLDSVLMNVVEPPQVRYLPDTAVCAGEPVQITTEFDGGGASFEWMDPGNTLSCTDCPNPIATVDQTTTYEIELQADGSQCASPSSYTLEVRPSDMPPELRGGSVCAGESVALITGGLLPDARYRITGGGVDLTDPGATVSPATTTTYTVTTTGVCESFEEMTTISVREAAVLTVSGGGAVCGGEETTLTASVNAGAGGGTFSWVIPGVGTLSGPQVRVTVSASTMATVSFTNDCGTVSEMVALEVIDAGSGAFAVEATNAAGLLIDTAFSGNAVTLTVVGLPADRSFTVNWSGNFSPATASGTSITVTVPEGTTQPLDYVATITDDGAGCAVERRARLAVSQSRFSIPEIFSPNRDGTNDGFGVYVSGEVTDFNLVVFNRWGNKVFSTTDPDARWDGSKDGEPQVPDVYYYRAKFVQNGTERTEAGEVTLVR